MNLFAHGHFQEVLSPDWPTPEPGLQPAYGVQTLQKRRVQVELTLVCKTPPPCYNLSGPVVQ